MSLMHARKRIAYWQFVIEWTTCPLERNWAQKTVDKLTLRLENVEQKLKREAQYE